MLSKSILNKRFCTSLLAGAATMAILAPQAMAQSCSPMSPAPGDTVTCDAGTYNAPIAYTVDDLTVVIGEDGTATTVSTSGNAVDLFSASGDLSLTIEDSGTSVSSTNLRGVEMSSSGNNMSLYADGTISGVFQGVLLVNNGGGTTTAVVENVYSSTNSAVRVETATSSRELNFTSTGFLIGDNGGFDGMLKQAGNATLTFNDVAGNGADAVFVRSTGNTGTLTVNTSGTVYGSRHGISLLTRGTRNGGAVTVNTDGSLIGGLNAVQVNNRNNVYANLDGTVTGTNRDGANVTSTEGSAEFDVAANASVSGARFGIFSSTLTGTDITIRNNAVVDGGMLAMRTQGFGGIDTNDTIFNQGMIMAGVSTFGGDDQLTLTGNGDIGLGARVNLGDGSDSLNLFKSNTFAGEVFGGIGADPGTDFLKLLGPSGGTLTSTGAMGNNIRFFEVLRVNTDNWALTGDHRNYQQIDVYGANTVLDGRAFADFFYVRPGGEIDLANGTQIIGDVLNRGTIDIAGSGTTGFANVSGVFTQGADGTLNIDAVAVGDNDLLRIYSDGIANLDGTLNLNQTYALEEGRYTIINATQALNGTFATVNGLGSGVLLEQSVDYVAATNRVDIVTTPLLASGASPDMTKTSSSAANYLVSFVGEDNAYGKLGFNVGTLDSFGAVNSATLALTPAVIDSVVTQSGATASRFASDMSDCSLNLTLSGTGNCTPSEAGEGQRAFLRIRSNSSGSTAENGMGLSSRSADISIGRLMSADDAKLRWGVMAGYSQSGSLGRAIDGQVGDGLEAATWSAGAFASRPGIKAGDFTFKADGTMLVSDTNARTLRNIDLNSFGVAEQAEGEFSARRLDMQGRFTLTGQGDSELSLRPFVAAGSASIWQEGYRETGADLLGLTVEGRQQSYGWAGAGAEYVRELTGDSESGLTSLVRVTGKQYFGDTEGRYEARFSGADGGGSFYSYGADLTRSWLLESGLMYRGSERFGVALTGHMDMDEASGEARSAGASVDMKLTW